MKTTFELNIKDVPYTGDYNDAQKLLQKADAAGPKGRPGRLNGKVSLPEVKQAMCRLKREIEDEYGQPLLHPEVGSRRVQGMSDETKAKVDQLDSMRFVGLEFDRASTPWYAKTFNFVLNTPKNIVNGLIDLVGPDWLGFRWH
jgi:hypothetical protein